MSPPSRPSRSRRQRSSSRETSERVREQQREEAPDREERAKRHPLLASLDPVPDEDRERKRHGRQGSEQKAADHGLAKADTQERRQLHVPHPEGVAPQQGGAEQGDSRSEAGPQPLGGLVGEEGDLRGEQRTSGGNQDPIRDLAVLEVDRREDSEHNDETDREQSARPEPEVPEHGGSRGHGHDDRGAPTARSEVAEARRATRRAPPRPICALGLRFGHPGAHPGPPTASNQTVWPTATPRRSASPAASSRTAVAPRTAATRQGRRR